MSIAKVHVVGAGLAGLATAVSLARRRGFVAIEISDAADHAGGRCRSYLDPTLGMSIDNGNHLVLSGNRSTHDFLETVDAPLPEKSIAAFPFVDLANGVRWTVRPNRGPLPWWVLLPSRRVPGTAPLDYVAIAALLRARPGLRVDEVLPCRGAVWDRLLRPLLLAALNTEPETAAASLAGTVIRETLAKGAAACRPLVAPRGLSAMLVEPAERFLHGRGISVQYRRRVRRIRFATREGQPVATALEFGNEIVPLAPGDAVVLAVPPWIARDLVPNLLVPRQSRPIVNGHFRFASSRPLPQITGIVGGAAEWLFAFPDRLSVTVSNAGRFLNADREQLALRLWEDVAAAHDLPPSLPPWTIVIEKRATFAAVPEEVALRPGVRTRWANLFLAGDWVDTGLPATIESAIRSGQTAATEVLRIGESGATRDTRVACAL
jgi:squalene-associated FAD-dependent desaturase